MISFCSEANMSRAHGSAARLAFLWISAIFYTPSPPRQSFVSLECLSGSTAICFCLKEASMACKRAGTGTRSRQPQSERGYRAGSNAGRANRRFGRPLWRVVVLYHHIWCCPGCLHAHQYRVGPVGLGSLSIHPAESLPLHARRHPGACHHDEPEPAGHQGPPARRARF